MTILDYFPYKEFRPKQKEILEDIEDNLSSYDYFILETPTGFGKSAVAYTVARYIRQELGQYSHFLASNKFLQEQYLTDFPDITLVKGRSNFWCPRYPSNTCDQAYCTYIRNFTCPQKPKYSMVGDKIRKDKHGILYDWSKAKEPWCPYWVQKDNAVRSDLTIHNYHYFLNEQNLTNSSFNNRYLGIFDEAHMIETLLMDFVKTSLTIRTLNTIYKVVYPNDKLLVPRYNSSEEWVEWLGKLHTSLVELTNKLEFRQRLDQTDRFSILYYNMVERVYMLKENMKNTPDNWVWEYDEFGVHFKPITINEYTGNLFNHVDKSLLMSATILDPDAFKTFLGIKDDVFYTKVEESNFPYKNRLIKCDYAGKATSRTMGVYLEKMLDRLDNHIIPDNLQHKGVIHTHTNDISRYILDRSRHSMYMTTTVDKDREDAINNFFNTDAPRIMVSPSLNEGVDLMGDLCRWQVICKVPYPYIGDPQIKARMMKDKKWYGWQTMMTLIQTYGRGCRSIDDWCTTYVLDEKFKDIVNDNWKLLPKWFKEAITI